MIAPRVDLDSPTWLAVAARVREEMEDARTRLETPGLPPAETEHERGRIALARRVLELADPPLSFEMDEAAHGAADS